MVTFWFTKIKLGLSELNEVPERYYGAVRDRLVTEGLYGTDGSKLAA